MNHLDEGTIHAWLDGALNATQSAEIDAHVKTCAECSAKVAEARGLIAASSRILVSLDDTPANVIPKKAPVAPKRPRRMAPWVSGLAAAAILVTLWRTSGVEQPAPRSEIKVPEIKVLSDVPEPTLSEVQQPVSPPPAAPVPAERRQAKVANTPRLADGRAASGAGAVGGLAAGAAADLAAAQSATAPTAARSPAEPIRAMVQREEAQRREANAGEALRRSRTGAVDSQQLAALKAEALALVGCYRIPERPNSRLESVVVTGSTEARAPEKAARARGAVTSAAPAPAAVQKSADADVIQGLLVNLDAQGTVRAMGTDSIIGSWLYFAPDSARILLGSRSPLVSGSNKVRCP